MVNHPNRSKQRQPVYVTSDARARFANSTIDGLIRNFAIGDIRSVSILTVWCDGEVGGDYHIEDAEQKAKLIAQYERMLRILKGEEPAPPYLG